MHRNHRNTHIVLLLTLLSGALVAASPLHGAAPAQNATAPATVAKSIGAIKAINGSVLTVSPDSGPDITANVQPSARLLRLAPGETDLKKAESIPLPDLQVGDKVRVRGYASSDGKSIATLEVIVISRSVVAAVSDKIRQDWQKRGIGGPVTAVDAASATVTISVAGFSGKKSIAVHASKSTSFRRYAPDSVKFEDASPSSIAEIHAGDQLRARGERSSDGAEFKAEEIVTGNFRNVAGTVNAVDAGGGTVTVQDVLSKKSVQVKITSDSQLHQLPPEIAQRIAARLKAAIAGSMPTGVPGAGGASSNSPAQTSQPAAAPNGSTPNGGAPGTAAPGSRSGGAPDFQQLLNRMPVVALADLHKGDAVMIVTTQGSPSHSSTAITLLSGVDPILRAAPNATDAMMLTPWSLGGGVPGGDTGSP